MDEKIFKYESLGKKFYDERYIYIGINILFLFLIITSLINNSFEIISLLFIIVFNFIIIIVLSVSRRYIIKFTETSVVSKPIWSLYITESIKYENIEFFSIISNILTIKENKKGLFNTTFTKKTLSPKQLEDIKIFLLNKEIKQEF